MTTMLQALLLLALVLTGLVGVAQAQAGGIQCGSTLGPGGTYVLDHHLTCPASAVKHGEGVLRVIGGATLNLKGHTVACANKGWGIQVIDATLKNGTIQGCKIGVIAGGSLVKRLTLTDNDAGVFMTGEWFGGGNLIVNNLVKNGLGGFFVEEADDNTLIDNIVQDTTGLAGFFLAQSGGNTLIGNVAIRNRVGFLIDARALVAGNRAEHNGSGFEIVSTLDLTGNVAKGNTGAGFLFGPFRLRVASHNVAEGNGDDGFRISIEHFDSLANPPPAMVVDNYAMFNGGKGLHVASERGVERRRPLTTITGNTAIRNRGGDLADDLDCRWTTWQDNHFGTASPACVH